MIKRLYFDFDGTISDAHEIAYHSLVRALDDFEYRFSRQKAGRLLGTKMHILLRKLNVHPKNLRKIRRRFYRYFINFALEGKVKLCTSVEPLWRLSEKYPLVVISNSETRFLKASIKKLGIRGLFKKVYGAEKFTSKDKLLEKLFRKHRIKPSEALYVGDRFSDVEFARKAGCIAVAIHNKCSWSSLKAIKKEKPDYIVRNFEELRELVRKLDR